MKAIKEVGLQKIIKYLFEIIIKAIFNILFLPQLKVWFLRLLGAKIGKNTIIHQIKFINVYRTGFKGLEIGSSCFLADGVLLDLADKIVLEDQVTLAVRSSIFTHTNVGYKNHPLQKYFPSFSKPVKISTGSFIGTGSIILSGVVIGKQVFVGAGSVVNKSIASKILVAGVPAKKIKNLK